MSAKARLSFTFLIGKNGRDRGTRKASSFEKLLRLNDRARSEKLVGSGSNETTRPLGPTILAARKVKKPTLAPTSTTVDPLRNISTNNSVVRSSYHPRTAMEGEIPMSLG